MNHMPGRLTTRAAAAAAVAVALAVLVPRGVRADEFENIHAAAGQVWYDQYCRPCHGAAGAPGTAVYADTKATVDLRTYVARNGGRFPAAQWIAVVATDNPALSHTPVWQRIRRAHSQSGPAAADVAGRAVVASIASYVRSIQQ
jgi:mono/diheme cytochrome c family protein